MAGLDDALAGAVAWIKGNLLVDTVRISRPGTGAPVLDETTGRLVYPGRAVVYEGPGAVQVGGGQAEITGPSTAGQPWLQETRSSYRLLTPLEAPVAARDDVVTVVAVHNPANAELIGREWLVTDPGAASTVEVVRSTPLDQMTMAEEETP